MSTDLRQFPETQQQEPVDVETQKILSEAAQAIPKEIWDSIAAAQSTIPRAVEPTYFYSSIGTS